MSPKVSILVPVYNTAAFIEKSAHSLFQQTFQDVEYLFWDDASTDNSIQLLQNVIDLYPNRKSNIRLFSNAINKGVSAVRSDLLSEAKGTYISMVDSDDFIESNMIEELYALAVSEEADIVLSDLIFEYPNASIRVKDLTGKTNEEYFKFIISNKDSNSLCTKLIKHELFNISNCIPPKGLNYAEDWFMLIHLYYFAKKITKIDKGYYHYNQHSSSTTKQLSSMHFESIMRFWDLITDFLRSKSLLERYQEEIQFQKINSKVNLMMGTNSYALRKSYASLYVDEELRFLSNFRWGNKILILLLHYKFFLLAHVFQKMVALKNNNKLS